MILLAGISTYAAGLLIGRKSNDKGFGRMVMALALIIDFGILFCFKYTNFFIENINAVLNLLDGGVQVPLLNLILPLGISFYTFQTASYVIDVYRGKTAPEKNFAQYFLFVSYFPQLIQGPINKYDEMKSQFISPKAFDWENISIGVGLMLYGYFKKIIIGDNLAIAVKQVFNNYPQYGGAVVFTGVLIYGVQIYCDFSGGIDVALGASRLFGISLTQNFKQPFFAVSVDDFWRRWHISLGRWMKDYVFYPLALSKGFTKLGRISRKVFKGYVGKVLPTCSATFIVFVLVGIWQGGSWKFIAYGLWNGAIISLGTLFKPTAAKIKARLHLKDTMVFMWCFGVTRTLILVTIGRYFSRGASFMSALRMLKHTFVSVRPYELFDGTLLSLGLSIPQICIVSLSLFPVLAVGIIRERGKKRVIDVFDNLPLVLRFVICLIFILIVWGIFFGGHISQEFIYQNV